MLTASHKRGVALVQGGSFCARCVSCASALTDSEDSPRYILRQTELAFLSAATEPFSLRT